MKRDGPVNRPFFFFLFLLCQITEAHFIMNYASESDQPFSGLRSKKKDKREFNRMRGGMRGGRGCVKITIDVFNTVCHVRCAAYTKA